MKLEVARNFDVSIQDTVRDLQAKIKLLERSNHSLEEQKAMFQQEVENERHKRKKLCDPRTLSADDKYYCKSCVQNLLTAAKETMQLTAHSNNSTISGIASTIQGKISPDRRSICHAYSSLILNDSLRFNTQTSS